MKRIILACAIAIATTAVWAEPVKLFVVQKGGGVIERPGNVTVEAAKAALNEAPPEGATGLVIEKGKPVRWTTLSAREINENYGGEGDPQVELFPEVEDPNPPVELFPEENDNGSAAIVPRAGNWIGKLVSQTTSGCPAGVAEGVAGQLVALDGARIPGPIEEYMSPANIYPQLAWTRRGANGWLGTAEMGDGKSVIIRVQWAIRIESSDRISNRQQLNFAGPIAGNCQALTEVDLLRQ